MSNEVTLKPCPFCGGERARTIHIRDGRKVACICGACSKPCFHGPLDQPSAEERAITAWNTRAASEREAKLVEALQMAIDVFEGMNDDEINVELLPNLRQALKGADHEQG